MAFHLTARYATVNDKLLLSALCRRRDWTWAPTCIELNAILGNNDGKFVWDSSSFGTDAKDVRLIDHHILSARLKCKDGSWTERPVTVDLAERIENIDGELHFHKETLLPRRYGI